MRNSTIARFLASCFFTSTAFSAAALDIKGMEAGKQLDCKLVGDISNYDAWQSCKSDAQRFFVPTTFLGSNVSIFVLRDSALVVSALRLEGFDFDQAKAALSAKYGRPKSKDSLIQNAMGAKFPQTELSWESDRAVLTVRRHGDKIGTPSISLQSIQAMIQFMQKREANKSDI